jgi:hypothetical protein
MRGSLPDLHRLVDVLQAHGPNMATEVAIQVAAKAPVGDGDTSGRLRDSIHGEADAEGDSVRITVSSDAPEATFVIEGTRPHDIYPRDKQALFWPSAEHPVKHVHHPGTQPNPFGEQAQEEITAVVEAELPQIVQEAIAS